MTRRRERLYLVRGVRARRRGPETITAIRRQRATAERLAERWRVLGRDPVAVYELAGEWQWQAVATS